MVHGHAVPRTDSQTWNPEKGPSQRGCGVVTPWRTSQGQGQSQDHQAGSQHMWSSRGWCLPSCEQKLLLPRRSSPNEPHL